MLMTRAGLVMVALAMLGASSGAAPYPCGGGPCGHGAWPPASWRPYAAGSAFNRRIPARAPRLATSARIIARILGDISANDQPGNLLTPQNGIAGWPTYWGRATDPVYTIHCTHAQWGRCSVEGMRVHAPAGAVIQGGNNAPRSTDRHLTIIDQTSGREIDLWHVDESPLPPGGGRITAEFGGYTMLNGDGREIGTGEGTASRLGNIAGRVRLEELEAAIASHGYMHHALSIVVDCTSGGTVYPAGDNPGQVCKSPHDAPPMGARLHLDLPLAAVNALPIPEWKKVFLRTLVVYGAIIDDTGSNFYFDWQIESDLQYRSVNGSSPWLAFGERQHAIPHNDWVHDTHWPGGGTYTGTWQRTNDGIDWTTTVWSKLEVVDPCVSRGSC